MRRPTLTPTQREALLSPHSPVAAYLVYIGGRTLIVGDGLVAHVLPGWFTYLWATCLSLGGLLILAGLAGTRQRTENAGHGFHLAGLVLLLAVVISQGLTGLDNLTPIVMLASVSLLRLRVLRRDREAREAAARLLAGEQP